MPSIVNRLRGSEIARTSATSIATLMLRVFGTAGTFLYTLLLARILSPEDVGLVWAIWSATFLTSTFTTFNIGSGAVREIVKARAEGDENRAAGFIVACRNTIFLASPLAIGGMLLVSWWQAPESFAEHRWAYVIAALSVPVLGWIQVNGSQATALHQMLKSQLPREMVRPIIFIAGFAACWLAGFRPSVALIMVLFGIDALVTALIQFWLLRSAFSFMRGTQPDKRRWPDWLLTGLTLTPYRLINEFLGNIVILGSALVLDTAGVALIAIAFRIVNFPSFGITAIEVAFGTKIAQALSSGDKTRADHFSAVSALLKIVPTAFACALLIVFAEPILSLFGADYVAAAAPTAWFLLMPLSRALFGNTNLVLQMKGFRRVQFWSALVTMFAMVGAIVLGGRMHGAEGAAAGGALVYVALQVYQYWACLRRTGNDPSFFGAVRHLVPLIGARLRSAER